MSTPARRRLAALGRLAALYARHTVRRAVHRSTPGAGAVAFEAMYRPLRLTAVTPAERAQLPAHGLCIACGLCTFAAPRAAHLRADRLPTQLTRSLPDLWTARDLPLDAVDWPAGAAVCPTGVPLPAMRSFVAARLASDGSEPPLSRPGSR